MLRNNQPQGKECDWCTRYRGHGDLEETNASEGVKRVQKNECVNKSDTLQAVLSRPRMYSRRFALLPQRSAPQLC